MRPNAKLGVAAAILLLAGAAPARADREETIFYNNFDNVAAGTLPAPWQIVYSGNGVTNQVVSRDKAFSGKQSLKLWGGTGGSSSVVQRPFETEAPVLAVSFRMLISAYGWGNVDHPGFFRQRAESWWGTWYGSPRFDHTTRKILDERYHNPIGGEWTWSPNTWYQVKILVDRITMRTLIWVNGVKIEDEHVAASHPELINSLGLVAGHAGVPVYYDNVRVFLPGFQETGKLLLDEIDQRLAATPPLIYEGAAGELKAHLMNAMENEDGGDLSAAISDMNNFRIALAGWGRPDEPPRMDFPPHMLLMDCDHMTKLANQMLRQLLKRLK